jgi:hypothetical protein
MTDSPIENPQPQEADSPLLRTFEDLSLAEVLVHFIVHPVRTWAGLRETLGRLPEDRRSVPVLEAGPLGEAPAALAGAERGAVTARKPFEWRRFALPLTLGGLSLLALFGSLMIDSEAVRRSTDFPLGGVVMLAAAVVLAVAVALGVQMKHLPRLSLPGAAAEAEFASSAGGLLAVWGFRLAALGAAVLLSFGAWLLNGDNTFTPMGMVCWALSVLAWVIVFAPRRVSPFRWIGHQWGHFRVGLRHMSKPRWSWTVFALIVILLVGGWFRFNNLSAYPPDMTSDHVEKLLDTMRVLKGDTPVFFPNNGGRESFQMYYLAVLHQLTGVPISFDLLKIGSGLEGMLTILLAWWLGRAIFGKEDRKLGNLVGLIMAALVATSYWHTMLSRLGLRIVLTTPAITVFFIFLALALRYNRRRDYLIAGLTLGISVYFYQAMRMAPLIAITGFILALIFRVRSWRALGHYLFNFAALTIVAIAVFVPLGHYMFQYPGSFWERTGGRFFGEDTAPILDSKGNVIGERLTTAEERMAALAKNIPVFADNLRKTAWMFNIRGDNAWVTGDPGGSAELDTVAGAFFILGLGIVAVRMFRRRDPVDWLLPASIAIMVLPSALSIAFPIEVPSSTRASGALPFVLLIAALGMAVVVKTATERIQAVRLRYLVYGALVVLLALGALMNVDTYFNVAMAQYRNSTFPYHQAGAILRGFSESTGASGNAFMIGWTYGWDHRALAIESGDPEWNNGIINDLLISRIKGRMVENAGTRYEVQPDRQLMFFLGPNEKESLALLQGAFPDGSVITVEAFSAEKNAMLYVAPPPGCAWIEDTLKYVPSACVKQPGE